MSAHDSNGYFVEIGEYSLILAKVNLSQRPRVVADLREVWLGDNAAVDAAIKELKAEGEKGKAVALLRLKNRSLFAADAALAKKVNSASAAEDYIKEALGADNYPANWSWVSQKDGRPPEAGTPWLLDATPATSTDEALRKIAGWSFDLLRCEAAILALAGAVSSAAKTASLGGPVLLCDVSELRSHLLLITGQGVSGFATIPAGFDAMAEATQGALGLKFRGSAARLMFNESYDFTDAAAKIAEPLVAGIRGALPSLGIAPGHLLCSGVLARQTWLTQAMASALNLKLLAIDAGSWATAQGVNLGAKGSEVAPSWLGVLGAIGAYDPRNPGAALPWNPILTNTPVAPSPVVPAIIQEPPPPAPVKAASPVITPPTKAPEPEVKPAPTPTPPAPKPEAAKPAPPPPKAAEPVKPAVVITPPPKPVEPPKPTTPAAKTPPPPAKPVEPKAAAKPEPKAAPAPAAKTPAKPEPAKPAPAAAAAAAKPALSPAPAPAVSKPSTAAPFPQKKSSLPMIIGIVIAILVLGGGGYFYMQSQKEKELLAQKARETEQRAAAEAAARRAAEEKAKQEAEARKKAEQEAAEKAVAAEKARIEAEKQARDELAVRMLNARGRLILNTDPAGATISVGELTPRPSPLDLKDLRLGRYAITISMPGFDTEQREVDIKADEVTDLGVIRLRRQVGSVEVTSDPSGLDYELKPAGALFVNPSDVRKGQTPATLNDLPVGSYQLTVARPNWPTYTSTLNVERGGTAKAHGTFVGGTVVINSTPAGAAVMRDQVQIGVTPLTLSDLQPGDVSYTLTQRGLEPATVSGRVEAGKTLTLSGTLLDSDRVMRPSELEERPVLVQIVDPELTPALRAEGGSALIEFVVGKDGTPTEMKIVNASSPAFGRACLTASAKWKFKPGMIRGKPVRTRMTAPFKMNPES